MEMSYVKEAWSDNMYERCDMGTCANGVSVEW